MTDTEDDRPGAPVYCTGCDCNPCMCGRREYMTERARARRDREAFERRWREDAWALPDYDAGG